MVFPVFRRLDCLTSLRTTYTYVVAARIAEFGSIKRVERLTKVPHHVVGSIYHIVDRTLTDCSEVFSEPLR